MNFELPKKILHQYRHAITILAFSYRRIFNYSMFEPKGLMHKIFDLTFLNQKTDVMYLSYPNKYHIIKDPKFASLLFSQHRGTLDGKDGSIFKGNSSMYKILQLLRYIYPDIKFDQNDCMLTCDNIHTKIYHDFIKKQLYNVKREDNITKNIVKNFSCLNGDVHINELVDNYVFDNFMSFFYFELFFSNEKFEFDKDIGIHLSNIHKFIYDNIDDLEINEETFKNGPVDSFEKLRKSIQFFSEKNCFDLGNFSEPQKISIIALFILFGQEKLTSFLKYAIFLLSKENNININYIDEIVDFIYNKSLVESSPFYAMGRFFSNDITIDGQFFHKNDIIALYPTLLYKNNTNNFNNFMPFGTGVHECPGKKLVSLEVKLLLKFLILNYNMTTKENKIDFSLRLIRKLENNLVINFEKKI